MKNDFFPSHFLAMVCGWPGSGKTTLIKKVLKHKDLLYEKFDEVLVLSPSCNINLIFKAKNFMIYFYLNKTIQLN